MYSVSCDIVGVTETDDAFVTILNVERAIAQVLGFNYGRQQKQRCSHQQSCGTDQSNLNPIGSPSV